jgi:TonB-linked SusC/RagA family outer membrane protein
MNHYSLKKNRKVVVALLLCTGFLMSCPLSALAEGTADSVQSVDQQSRRVTGTVTDATEGGVIIGASVLEKGTTNGTITDVNGNFALNVSSGTTLLISYVGYVSQEVVVDSRNNYGIILKEDAEMLDEVVVVGYGSTKRKNFTGSVSTVKTAETPLALMPVNSAFDMLRGTATGITVSQQQGAGQTPNMMVRGQKSVQAQGDNVAKGNPLIVLDGMIFAGKFRDIDPSTIESMSVLKDATSLAAYGSQAANGVIMITSKKGQLGKPKVNVNASWAVSEMANKPDVLSPQDYIRKINLLQGLAEDADPTQWMKGTEAENYRAGKIIDWLDYVTRTGLMQNYSASVTGGTERMNYFLSSSHLDQQGILEGDDYNREAFMARIQSDITSWLQIGGQANYTFSDYSGPSVYDIYQAIRLTPYGSATRPNGEIEKYPREEGIYMTNPLWGVKSGTIDDHDTFGTMVLKGHALVKAPWVEGLSYRLNASYMLESIERDYFTHEGNYVIEGSSDDRYSPSAVFDLLSRANGYSVRTKNTHWMFDNILNYNRQFGKHFVDLTYVYTRDSYKYNYRRMEGSDFSALGNTALGYNGLTYAATQKITNIDLTEKNNVGYLGRINYNYNDTYHISVSVRRDGSSVFGVNNKWGNFPAAGLAWTVTNEEFMRKAPAISYLKLKASWGINGNQSLNPYDTLSKMTLGQSGGHSYPFGNTSTVSWGQRYSALGNESLGWESTEAYNFGFDLGLLDDRIRLEIDAYSSKTTEQIFSRTIPVMANGITSMRETMGQVDNWGIEATLNTRNFKNKDWEWGSTLTFYLNRNKLKDLYGDGKDDIANSLFIGKSLGAIYGYKAIGIVQEGDTEYIAANGAQPGDVMFANEDKSEDGKITSDDRTILGYNRDNFRMNLSNTVKYKDFELYVLFTGIFSGSGYGRTTNIYAYRTASDVVWDNNFNHGWWTAENKSNTYPRIAYTDSRYTPVQNYGFVRLQDLSLSYTFRQPWVKKLQISNLKAFFAAKNLFTITGWEGGDPEIKQTLGSGYNYGYPLATTYSLGLNLTF